MIANAIERSLVKLATYAGADDPEAVAHDIIVRALEGRVVVRERAQGYLATSARNQTEMYRRHTKRLVHGEWTFIEESHEESVNSRLDARLELEKLTRGNPAGLAFMLAYVDGSHHPSGHRVKAMRLRRQMKEMVT